MPDPAPPPLPRLKPPPLWRQTLDEHDELEEGDQRGNQGIGGWLILFAVGRVLAPFFLGAVLLRNLAIFTKPNVWSVLTTPGSTAYHPLWSIAIIYETGGNAILLLFSLVLVSLFFARLKAFVPLMMAYMVLLALFLWGDLLVGQQIPAVSAHSDGKELFSAVQATVTAVIWIPYFLTSVRVRHTFVK